jgi:hypothetical protein
MAPLDADDSRLVGLAHVQWGRMHGWREGIRPHANAVNWARRTRVAAPLQARSEAFDHEEVRWHPPRADGQVRLPQHEGVVPGVGLHQVVPNHPGR